MGKYNKANDSNFEQVLYNYLWDAGFDEETIDGIIQYNDYQVWDSYADFGKETFWEETSGIDIDIGWMSNAIDRCMDWESFGRQIANDEMYEIGGKIVHLYSW